MRGGVEEGRARWSGGLDGNGRATERMLEEFGGETCCPDDEESGHEECAIGTGAKIAEQQFVERKDVEDK